MFYRLKSFFISSDIDDPAIQREVRKANLIRSLITTFGAVLFSAAIISAFYQNVETGTALEMKWRQSIIALNQCMIVANTCITLIGIYTLRYKTTSDVLYTYLPYVVLVVIGVWGVSGTVIHQLIHWNIIPFFLATFVFVMLLIRPVVLFYYFVLLYAVFYFCVGFNQTNPNYILINRAVGFAALLLSYSFSLLTWNNNLVRFRQTRLIELQTEELKESNASKDKFFTILSHDLKGPVASALMLTDLLQEENLSDSEKKEIHQLFRSSLENISRLLNNVLLWSNNQTGKISFNPSPIKLKALINEDIQLMAAMSLQKNLTVFNDVPEELVLHADEQMMHTIVRNLLANAIKFTNTGGEIEISAAESRQISQVKLSVADNGVGMPASLLNDLFKLDKKIMTPGTDNETGTGLGLILCKDFVEKHRGQLFVESEINKGSRFTILFPSNN